MTTRILITALIALTFNTSLCLAQAQTLLEARADHQTTLIKFKQEKQGLDQPQKPLFDLVKYNTELGDMDAYLSTPPDQSKRYPAIIWVTGGFPSGGIGAGAWKPQSMDNDQSAQDYRLSGLVMMYPSFRGTADNPGYQESFYGEVNDIISAANYLAKVKYVDPKRIYLGGHSTGGTLVLLAAETGYPFKAVFSFGPVSDPARYGEKKLNYDLKNAKEAQLRAPIHHLDAIKSNTYVIEGSNGNQQQLMLLKEKSNNSKVKFMTIQGASHFDILGPINRFIARDIVKLTAEQQPAFSNLDLQGAYDDVLVGKYQISDLNTLADLRYNGLDLSTPKATQFYFFARQQLPLDELAKATSDSIFKATMVESKMDKNGKAYYRLILSKHINFLKLEDIFTASKTAKKLGERFSVQYDGWYVD
jgi:dienelactone hydrolase